MKKLQEELERLLYHLEGKEHILKTMEEEPSIFPFSRESRIMAYLLSIHAITYEKYLQLFYDYTQRNQFLPLFDMSPRSFGETWGEKHVLALFPQVQKATKENVSSFYPNFDGEFDLWWNGLRIEVKACRANRPSTKNNQSLISRAYLHHEALEAGFKYHFQQLKPSCCDIFLWIGVCRDELLYWVLTSTELEHTGKMGSQHRTEHTGVENSIVFEGQVFMTEEELTPFLVKEQEILQVIQSKRNVSLENIKTNSPLPSKP